MSFPCVMSGMPYSHRNVLLSTFNHKTTNPHGVWSLDARQLGLRMSGNYLNKQCQLIGYAQGPDDYASDRSSAAPLVPNSQPLDAD